MIRPDFRPADCRFYPGQPGYELTNDFSFIVASGSARTIPAGFWFNGASIPAAFWQITFSPFDPRIIDGALIHDWLYTSKQVPRKVADNTFAAFLLANSHAGIRTEVVRYAVRMFGGLAWLDSKRDREYLTSLKQMIRQRGAPLSRYGL